MHVHGATTAATKRVLRLSLIATIAYVLLTLVAGLRAHSLALVSEAGHNASDALAVALSFVAVWFQTRPATDTKTFGYQRAGVLAAFINALMLIVIAGWIAWTATMRLQHPTQVEPRIMMAVAAAGVLMNGAIATALWQVSHDVNIRSVFIHMLGDTLSTAAVIHERNHRNDATCAGSGTASGGSRVSEHGEIVSRFPAHALERHS